jgi:hypothetical protein
MLPDHHTYCSCLLCSLTLVFMHIHSFIYLFNLPVSLYYHYHQPPLLPQFYQRPAPNGAQDIGTWMTIFQVLSIAAVVTNGALICFTMDVLWDRFSLAGRLWYVLSLFKLLCSQL